MNDPNPLIAEKEETDPLAGTLAEDVKGLVEEIQSGEAGFDTILDGLDIAARSSTS